eukprot:2239629-Rhodomonas_salina.2
MAWRMAYAVSGTDIGHAMRCPHVCANRRTAVHVKELQEGHLSPGASERESEREGGGERGREEGREGASARDTDREEGEEGEGEGRGRGREYS